MWTHWLRIRRMTHLVMTIPWLSFALSCDAPNPSANDNSGGVELTAPDPASVQAEDLITETTSSAVLESTETDGSSPVSESTLATSASSPESATSIESNGQQFLSISAEGFQPSRLERLDFENVSETVVFDGDDDRVVSNEDEGITISFSDTKARIQLGVAIDRDRLVRDFDDDDDSIVGEIWFQDVMPPGSTGFGFVILDRETGEVLASRVIPAEGSPKEAPFKVLSDGTFAFTYGFGEGEEDGRTVTEIIDRDGNTITTFDGGGSTVGSRAFVQYDDDSEGSARYLSQATSPEVARCDYYEGGAFVGACLGLDRVSGQALLINHVDGFVARLPIPCFQWGGTWLSPVTTPDGGALVWSADPASCETTAEVTNGVVGYGPDGEKRWESEAFGQLVRSFEDRLLVRSGCQGADSSSGCRSALPAGAIAEYDQATGELMNTWQIDVGTGRDFEVVAAGDGWILVVLDGGPNQPDQLQLLR